MPQQRIAPSARQIRTAKELLGQVPTQSYDWTSKAGHDFLEFMVGLQDAGVPVAWLAVELDLDPGRLYATLARHRTRSTLKSGGSK